MEEIIIEWSLGKEMRLKVEVEVIGFILFEIGGKINLIEWVIGTV